VQIYTIALQIAFCFLPYDMRALVAGVLQSLLHVAESSGVTAATNSCRWARAARALLQGAQRVRACYSRAGRGELMERSTTTK
jgi:hypothetical protein